MDPPITNNNPNNPIGIDICNLFYDAYDPDFHPCFEIVTNLVWPQYALLPASVGLLYLSRYCVLDLAERAL